MKEDLFQLDDQEELPFDADDIAVLDKILDEVNKDDAGVKYLHS